MTKEEFTDTYDKLRKRLDKAYEDNMWVEYEDINDDMREFFKQHHKVSWESFTGSAQ